MKYLFVLGLSLALMVLVTIASEECEFCPEGTVCCEGHCQTGTHCCGPTGCDASRTSCCVTIKETAQWPVCYNNATELCCQTDWANWVCQNDETCGPWHGRCNDPEN